MRSTRGGEGIWCAIGACHSYFFPRISSPTSVGYSSPTELSPERITSRHVDGSSDADARGRTAASCCSGLSGHTPASTSHAGGAQPSHAVAARSGVKGA